MIEILATGGVAVASFVLGGVIALLGVSAARVIKKDD